MRRQRLTPIAIVLSLLVLLAGPAQAGPIRFGEVVARTGAFGADGRQTVDLRLRTLNQSGQSGLVNGPTMQTPGGPNNGNGQGSDPAAGGNGSVTNTEVPLVQEQAGRIETVNLGDVTGTVCDCGPIAIIGKGFPKLPFLALAGIPLFFIPHGGDTPPDFTSPPTTPQTPVPEPASLLLLGTSLAALGAGARRRRAQARQLAVSADAREV